MIDVKTNLAEELVKLKESIVSLHEPDTFLRPVMLELVSMIHERIHIKGKATDGQDIGVYDKRYMSTREKHNRQEPQNKVVISLTRELESDYAVEATDKGYGIGFNNHLSFEKAIFCELHFGIIIFQLSKEELAYAQLRIEQLVSKKVV